MHKSTLLLFLILFSTVLGEPITQKEKPIIISKLCEMVHERAYFLKRLKKMIDLFKQLEQSAKIDTNFNDFSPELFSHPRIKRLILSLENTTNLGALFTMWDELHDYKYINDEVLIKEFTRFALLIAKKICPECYIKTINPLDITFALPTGSFTEAVTLRDYYTKRLKKPLEFLSLVKCNKNNLFESVNRDHECNCVFATHIRFKHGDINRCIELMSSTNSLYPLFQLAKEFHKYRLIRDEKFNREFFLLIFGVYKNLITYNAQHKNLSINKSTATLIAHIYENVDSLPLEQILDAIDLLSDELPHLLEKYDIKEDTDWKQWLKKNWWVPPLALGSLGIKIFLIFKNAPPHAHGHAPHSVGLANDHHTYEDAQE